MRKVAYAAVFLLVSIAGLPAAGAPLVRMHTSYY